MQFPELMPSVNGFLINGAQSSIFKRHRAVILKVFSAERMKVDFCVYFKKQRLTRAVLIFPEMEPTGMEDIHCSVCMWKK